MEVGVAGRVEVGFGRVSQPVSVLPAAGWITGLLGFNLHLAEPGGSRGYRVRSRERPSPSQK